MKNISVVTSAREWFEANNWVKLVERDGVIGFSKGFEAKYTDEGNAQITVWNYEGRVFFDMVCEGSCYENLTVDDFNTTCNPYLFSVDMNRIFVALTMVQSIDIAEDMNYNQLAKHITKEVNNMLDTFQGTQKLYTPEVTIQCNGGALKLPMNADVYEILMGSLKDMHEVMEDEPWDNNGIL